jgi:hypothetical protein
MEKENIMLKIYEIIQNHPFLKVEVASSQPLTPMIGSEIIKWFQGTSYSHVLIIINDMVFESSHTGVVTIPLEEFLQTNKIVNCIEIDKSKVDFEFLFYSLGKKYGYIQIFKIALKYLFMTKLKILKGIGIKDQSAKSLICSEYVGKALRLSWVNDYTDPEDIITYLLSIKA